VIIFSNLFAVIDAQNRWRFIDSGSTATTFLPYFATAKENTPRLAPRSINCRFGS
jgi:hypothetical protein